MFDSIIGILIMSAAIIIMGGIALRRLGVIAVIRVKSLVIAYLVIVCIITTVVVYQESKRAITSGVDKVEKVLQIGDYSEEKVKEREEEKKLQNQKNQEELNKLNQMVNGVWKEEVRYNTQTARYIVIDSNKIKGLNTFYNSIKSNEVECDFDIDGGLGIIDSGESYPFRFRISADGTSLLLDSNSISGNGGVSFLKSNQEEYDKYFILSKEQIKGTWENFDKQQLTMTEDKIIGLNKVLTNNSEKNQKINAFKNNEISYTIIAPFSMEVSDGYSTIPLLFDLENGDYLEMKYMGTSLFGGALTKVTKDNAEVINKTDNENNSNTNDKELIKFSSVEESSYLADTDSQKYIGNNIIDENIDNAWVEGKDGSGIGEWVKVYMKKSTTISTIEIANGYQKSQNTFRNNNRVKKIKIEFSDGSSTVRDLEDWISKFNVIKLESQVTTEFIKITILDVYKGDKYDDTCITSINAY